MRSQQWIKMKDGEVFGRGGRDRNKRMKNPTSVVYGQGVQKNQGEDVTRQTDNRHQTPYTIDRM
jgi:hypothetical protein